MDGLRVAAGAGYAADLPRNCRSGGRGIPHEDENRWTVSVWHSSRRKNHSRGGDRANGRRSEDLCAERLLPGARREEPVRDGRCSAGDQPGQKSDADDYGAVLARFGVPPFRSAKGEFVMPSKPRSVIPSRAKDPTARKREDL